MNSLAHIVHDLVVGQTTSQLDISPALSELEKVALAELNMTLLQLQKLPNLQAGEWATPPPRGLAQP